MTLPIRHCFASCKLSGGDICGRLGVCAEEACGGYSPACFLCHPPYRAMRTVSTAFSGRFGLYSAIPHVLHRSDVPCISGVNSRRAARTPYSVPFSGHVQIAFIYDFCSATEGTRLQGFRFCFRLEYFNCRCAYKPVRAQLDFSFGLDESDVVRRLTPLCTGAHSS